ncbi:cellular morphogenesis protein [Mucor ambiguus]|uniref:Cellular morphogenesis protein n=1 Tax=Mucor ambiguus TaxID=91626 RepID=A0A0C9M4N4_9FUNG|nr:cellular morphogenesis protein [Mucor ambiguus]
MKTGLHVAFGRLGLLLLLTTINLCRASYVTHPNINFDPVGKLGISGSYNGISLYTDTEQLTQIPTSTSSVVTLSNDTLKLIASSNANGIIYDACILSDTLYIAGNFSTLKGHSVNNIASIDLTDNNQIKPLKYGLDGPVYSVYCDTAQNQLYVGGAFIAPVDTSMVKYSDSLSQFGGSVAIWKNQQWSGLPWKGVNGPVYSIAKTSTSVLFAGQFNASTDGQPYHAPATQPISLSSSGVSATNTASNSAAPGSIICADATNTKPWILSDGVNGTWQTTFLDYSVNPVLIRISNSKLENHQTNQFSIRSLADATRYQLSYLDPDTNLTKTCSTNCSLSKNTNVLYQDFRITNISLTNGIAIDIHSWYGVGGGLASVKVFQSEIFAYAVDASASNMCASTTATTNSNSTTLPRILSQGNWTVSNTSIPYLTLPVTKSDLSSPPSVTFYPNLAESGLYEVLLYSPACSGSECSKRTDVDVFISTSASQTSNVTLAPSSTATSQSIFSGYFDVSANFTPSVKVALAKNASFSESASMTLVAHAVQFIKNPSVDVLASVIQYNVSQSAVSATSIPWGKLADNIPSQSIVKSMDVLQDTIYMAGNFSGSDKSNNKYTNIVQYDASARQLKALPNQGFNGPVESIVCTDTVVDYLANVARYNMQAGIWSALNAGVDGPVLAMSWSKDKQSIIVSGAFSQLLKTTHDASQTRAAAGTALWSTGLQQWTTSTDTPYMSGTVYAAVRYNSNDYYMGSLKSMQRYQFNDMSFISNDNTITSPFDTMHPEGSISAGVLYASATPTTLAKRDTSNGSTSMIFGGQFTLPGQQTIQNIAIYDNGAWSGVEGADWQGAVHSMAVHHDLLYVGGRFTGPSSHDLAIFDLTKKSLSLTPDIKTSDGSPASVNIVRHIAPRNTIVIGGNFTSVGSLSCACICSLDIDSLQWSSLGLGLVGQVQDVQWINGKLVATGNISLNNSPLTIAEYDYEKSTWGPFGTANLPGPSSTLSFDNNTQHVYVSGQANDASASTYIRVWDGQQFITPKTELGPGSSISGLSMLPMTTTNASSQNALLVSGFINLGTLGNVSAAFFDGDNWTPYLVTASANGDMSRSALNSVFYLEQIPFIAPSKNKGSMPTPLVILVSIAISLGIVFLIVLCSMLVVYIKRKRDSKINPQSNPGAYYGKPPRTPESLLAALKAAAAPEGDDHDRDEKEDGGRYLQQPENQQLYNMSRSISQEHLHEQSLTPFNPMATGGVAAMTTARAAPVPPTAHSRSYSQQQQQLQYNNMFGNTTAVNHNQGQQDFVNKGIATGVVGATAAAAAAASNGSHQHHDAARPESYARPYSEIQRDSNTNSFYNNQYTNAKEMSEIPSRYSPFNPFRNSEIGAAIAGGAAGAATGTAAVAAAGSNKNNASTSTERQPQTVTYSNMAPPETSSMAVTPLPESVRWTNASPAAAAAMSSAAVKPISLVGTSDGSSSLVDPVYGPGASADKVDKVRWTNAPNSQLALSSAVVTPIVSSLENRSVNNQSAQNSYLSPHTTTPLPSSKSSAANAFHQTAPSSSTTTSNVRWTNFNADEAVGVATIGPVSSDAVDDTVYPSGKSSALSNPSISNTIQSGEDFSNDPDIVRWTTAPSADKNKATATIAPVEPSESHALSSIGKSQPYKASLSSLAYPYNVDTPTTEESSRHLEVAGAAALGAGAAGYTVYHHAKNDSTSSADRVINTNAFRLSDAGSLAPIDTTSLGYAFNKDTGRQEPLSPDSAVRWKTANVGSPIETVHVPHILEPASALVTRRSANQQDEHQDERDTALENYYNNPQSVAPATKSNKYKPVVNESHYTSAVSTSSSGNAEMNEPIGRKSEAIDDLIASRDLNALSVLIDEEVPTTSASIVPRLQQQEESPVPQLMTVPTPSRSTPSPSGVNAIDGRAASKRMVEEYLTSKKTPAASDDSKKSKYKSDFTSVMAAAIKNNADSPVATEEKPHLYYAKFDFSAREHGELGFEKADPIIVVDSSDDIWWMGYKADKSDGSFIQGVFPSNYVEIAVAIR